MKRFTLNGKVYVVTSATRTKVRYATADTTPELTQYHVTTKAAFDQFVAAGLIKEA